MHMGIWAGSRHHCRREKGRSLPYSECVFVALVILHSERMRRVILLSVACVSLPYNSIVSLSHYDFRGKVY